MRSYLTHNTASYGVSEINHSSKILAEYSTPQTFFFEDAKALQAPDLLQLNGIQLLSKSGL